MLASPKESTFADDRDDNIDDLKKHLRERLSSDWSNFTTLPTYHIGTSLGESLVITSFMLAPSNGNFASLLCMIAQNTHGEIVGYQRRFVYDYGSSFEVTGYIYAGVRKSGLTIPLELVQYHVLQDLADTTGKDVVRKVKNGNLMSLERYRNGIGKYPTKEEHEELDRRYQEQKGWKYVYGEGGILGISWADQRDGENVGIQVIMPFPSRLPSCAHDIYLRRQDEKIPVGNGQYEIRANPFELERVRLDPRDSEGFRQQQMLKVKQILEI